MEVFKGISRWVHGSNGLIHDLIEAWIIIGESLKTSNETTELIAFLRNRLSLGDGGRAWNVAPSNSELRRFEDWKKHANILSECAAQLSLGNSEILSGLNRTNCLSSSNQEREHRIFLISWNLDFLDLINESLLATGFSPVEQQRLNLTEKEQHEVQFNILSSRKRDLRSRNDNDRYIAAVDQILALLQSELPEKRRQISDVLQEKGELLQSSGSPCDAMVAYRAAIEAEPDPDLKKALVEFVAEMNVSINGSPS